MPNAKDAPTESLRSIFLVGQSGTGKTTQFLTLPREKFIWLFDAHALASLRGYDLEYEEFLPDVASVKVSTLSRAGRAGVPIKSARVYDQWESDFETRKKDGALKGKWIGIDSATTLLDLIMDRVLEANGRAGQWPQQDDYGPQMNAFRNIMRSLMSCGARGVFLTGHLDTVKDETTGRVTDRPLLTGRLRTTVPLLFSDMLLTEVLVDAQGKTAKYTVRTRPNTRMTGLRTASKEVGVVEDVTIDWKKPVEGQGIGGLLKL